MILPADAPLAAAAVRRARRPVTARERLVTRAVSAGLRCGLASIVGSARTLIPAGGDPSIEDALSEMFATDVVVAIFLGPPRANRKPVMQVMTRAGGLLGFAKVGTTELTDRLTRAEARNLRELADVKGEVVVAPSLLGEFEWRGHPVTVQSPLPVWDQGMRHDPEVVTSVVCEIARGRGSEVLPWGTSRYAARLTEVVSRIADPVVHDAARTMLSLGIDASLELEFGAWHGDLSPWNMAVTADRRALVWDWERYSRDVPVGFDALHLAFRSLLGADSEDGGEVGVKLLDSAPEALAALGVTPDAARATATAYLVEIATRFTNDGQAKTGVSGGDARTWLVPAMRRMEEMSGG